MKGNMFCFKDFNILPRYSTICYILAIYFIFILGCVEKCYYCNNDVHR